MKISPRELKRRYAAGENISAILRAELGVSRNTQEVIEVSYDMQTGSYIESMKDPLMASHKAQYAEHIANEILSLCDPASVLEAGVGEATTLSGVLSNLSPHTVGYGFDLSWSRVAYAHDWLQKQGHSNVDLCTGDLLHIPFGNNSVDVVYTSHSIEPNGGREKPILKELFRVAKKFLVLLEPGYEFASEKSRNRMDQHGYCKNLGGFSKELGFDVSKHELFPLTVNPLNPTSILVIPKNSTSESTKGVFACPKYKTPLREYRGALYSEEALVAYPILGGIPCLRIENGIFASRYMDVE